MAAYCAAMKLAVHGLLPRLADDHPEERAGAAAALSIGAVAAAVAAIPPLIVRRLIDHAIPNREGAAINALAIGLVVVPVIGALLAAAHERRFEHIAHRLTVSLRARAAAAIRGEAGGSGNAAALALRTAKALDEMETAVGVALPRASATAFSLIAGLFAALLVAPLVALTAFAAVPLLFVLLRKSERLRAAASARGREHRERMSDTLQDAARASGAPAEQHQDRIRQEAAAFAAGTAANAAERRRMDLALGAVVATASALLWVAAGHRVAGGGATLGSVVAVLLYQLRALQSMRRLTLEPFRVPAEPLAIVYECIDRLPQDARPAGRMLRKLQGTIAFQNVGFNPRAGLPALRDVTFDVPPGRSLVVVGAPSAGPAALPVLLTRAENPDEGSVTLDGWDLRELTMDTVTRAVGVLQPGDDLPADTTVREYLKDARATATETHLSAAVRAAGLEENVRTSAGGLDSPLAVVITSEVDRIRLRIARLLLHDPAVVFIAEPRPFGDPTADGQIDAALATLVRGRTVIVVAARRATLAAASQVLVFDGGRAAERGTHEELLAARGLYARIFQEQFSAQPRIADVIA